MQMRLSHIMIVVTVFCVSLGLAFASPPVLGFPLLLALYIAIPAIVVTGVIWSCGRQRAFFIGAGASAIVPWLSASVFMFPEVVFRGRIFNSSFWQPAITSEWWMVHLILLSPVAGALVGGGAALLTFRIVVGRSMAETNVPGSEPRMYPQARE